MLTHLLYINLFEPIVTSSRAYQTPDDCVHHLEDYNMAWSGWQDQTQIYNILVQAINSLLLVQDYLLSDQRLIDCWCLVMVLQHVIEQTSVQWIAAQFFWPQYVFWVWMKNGIKVDSNSYKLWPVNEICFVSIFNYCYC